MEIRILIGHSENVRVAIHAVETGHEADPVGFLRSLGNDKRITRDALAAHLQFLAESGRVSRKNHRHVGDGCWEIKPREGRIVYFEDGEDIIVCAVGFLKPGKKKAQSALIERAKQLKRLYFADKAKGLITFVEASGDATP